MKKVTFAAIALICFSAASFAQTTPTVKKKTDSKMQVANKTATPKADAKTVAVNKPAKATTTKVVAQNPVNKTSTPVAAKAAPVSKTNTIAKNTNAVTKHTKKDGTPDKRFKENKKTS